MSQNGPVGLPPGTNFSRDESVPTAAAEASDLQRSPLWSITEIAPAAKITWVVRGGNIQRWSGEMPREWGTVISSHEGAGHWSYEGPWIAERSYITRPLDLKRIINEIGLENISIAQLIDRLNLLVYPSRNLLVAECQAPYYHLLPRKEMNRAMEHDYGGPMLDVHPVNQRQDRGAIMALALKILTSSEEGRDTRYWVGTENVRELLQGSLREVLRVGVPRGRDYYYLLSTIRLGLVWMMTPPATDVLSDVGIVGGVEKHQVEHRMLQLLGLIAAEMSRKPFSSVHEVKEVQPYPLKIVDADLPDPRWLSTIYRAYEEYCRLLYSDAAVFRAMRWNAAAAGEGLAELTRRVLDSFRGQALSGADKLEIDDGLKYIRTFLRRYSDVPPNRG